MPAGPRWNTTSPNRLNRICAAPPPLAQPTATSPMPKIKRRRSHVAQAFDVFVPGARDFVFGEVGSLPRGILFRRASATCTTRKTGTKRVEHECQLVAERRHRRAAEERSDGDRGPLRELRQRIGGVQFVSGGDGGKNRRAAAGEKRRREHQRAAQDVEQPGAAMRDREDEGERDHGAHQVAGDHDALAVHAIEQDARDGSGQDGGNGARDQDQRDHQAGAGIGERQAEDRDVVEVVADFADDLAGPGEAVIAIAPKRAGKSFIALWRRTPACRGERVSTLSPSNWTKRARNGARPRHSSLEDFLPHGDALQEIVIDFVAEPGRRWHGDGASARDTSTAGAMMSRFQ